MSFLTGPSLNVCCIEMAAQIDANIRDCRALRPISKDRQLLWVRRISDLRFMEAGLFLEFLRIKRQKHQEIGY